MVTIRILYGAMSTGINLIIKITKNDKERQIEMTNWNHKLKWKTEMKNQNDNLKWQIRLEMT